MSSSYTVCMHVKPTRGYLFGFPFLETTPAICPSHDFAFLTLTGDAAILMRQYKEDRGGETQFDLCGIIADRLEEYPGEASDPVLAARLVWCMRWMFFRRKSAVSQDAQDQTERLLRRIDSRDEVVGVV